MKEMKGIFLSFLWFLFIPLFIGTLRNLPKQVEKTFCFQNCFYPSLFKQIVLWSHIFCKFSITRTFFFSQKVRTILKTKYQNTTESPFVVKFSVQMKKRTLFWRENPIFLKCVVDSWQNLPVFAIFSFIWQANFVTKIGFTDMFQGLKFGHWSITLGITNWRTPFKQSWSTFDFGNLK